MAGSDGEWQHVVRWRGRAARAVPRCAREPRDLGDAGKSLADSTRARERLKEAMAELTCEDLWRSWKEVLTSRLLAGPRVPDTDEQEARCVCECVCYGLGSFLSSVSSRYQLAMLLLLLEALKIPPGRCSIFDPVFSAAECDVLRSLGLTVLTENEEGKRPVSRPTLFYLLHCGTALYNNLLWSNWSPQGLALLTIVGNSFQGLQERMVQKDLQRDYSFIAHVRSVCQETPLPCSPRFLDVFNDTAVVRFPFQRLATLPPHTWARAPEPRYLHCSDLEIILRDKERGDGRPVLHRSPTLPFSGTVV
ncbi:SRR1-like protein isoform X2 [Scleropages formosus]|uniref:SRR1 domain containing n=1 Tax=Scleropages formosus TaxID=113540 RepID=A0A8C9RS81_SCLFO|nr:SRR1-like protein isoform X2 [Scleropages formosus]